MMDKIKLSMRISHNSLDPDIQGNIDACLLDLQRVGVITSGREEDPLIVKAVELYCKWQYNYDNRYDAYRQAYESLRDGLSLTGEYHEK